MSDASAIFGYAKGKVMAFTDYKNLSMVLQKFHITYTAENFVKVNTVDIHPFFLEDFSFSKSHMDTKVSEYAICESMVYPILKESYKRYAESVVLWSHRLVQYDEDLSGTPDYSVATLSPLGRIVFGSPVLLLVEAKRNDFTEGWGQCAAAMVAAQKLNAAPTLAVYGMVTDGEVWRFGQLVDQTFIDNIMFYTINDLHELFGAIDYVFAVLTAQRAGTSRAAAV